MTRQSRKAAVIIAALVSLGTALAIGWPHRRPAAPPVSASPVIERGGDVEVAIRSEPRTFNRLAARDQVTELLGRLTQARLTRINRVTQEVEPALAESWTRSADGLQYTLKLRPSVRFSDGHPLSADDVLFSFAAAYDARTNSPIADALLINGKPLAVTAPDSHTVVIAFPSAFAPGLRILDALPILPKHRLDAAFKDGSLGKAWGISAPLDQIAGLGPFIPVEYDPGERLVLARNPQYWRTDDTGRRLPYIDRLILDIVPDQDASLLRLESGQVDLTDDEARLEDVAPLRRAAAGGRIQLLDLGVAYGADSFWLNLKPGAFADDPRRSWLQRDELREAISLAVDRQVFSNIVYLGAGVAVSTPETPANRKWYSAELDRPVHDAARAAELLASIGLKDRTGDGALEGPGGEAARFTLLTVKGSTALERGAIVIRDQLKAIGLGVDVVALDQGAVIQRFLSGRYDAVYFHVFSTDTDPGTNGDFWLSSGSAHIWNMGQAKPATDWEARIDDLMRRQSASLVERDRVALYHEMLRVFVEHRPVVYFVAPRVFVAASTRIGHLTPALVRPQLLWAADSITARTAPRGTH